MDKDEKKTVGNFPPQKKETFMKKKQNTEMLSSVEVHESNTINSNMIGMATLNHDVCDNQVENTNNNANQNEKRMKNENTKSAGISHPAAKMDNLGKCINSPSKDDVEIINEGWCINCFDEALYYFEESGLYSDVIDTIRQEISEACLYHFTDKLEEMGLPDDEIESLLRSRDYFRDFESVKEYYYHLDYWKTLADLVSVKEWCEGAYLLVDEKIMSLYDFLNLDTVSMDEFFEKQEDWFISANDRLSWELIMQNNLDFFEDVYGEEPDYQWLDSDWDGSKRIAPENRVA